MSRQRKAYRPRPVVMNAVALAISRAATLPAPDVDQQKARMALALDEFIKGRQCMAHWVSLADASNVAESLSALGICSDADSIGAIANAQAVLANVHGRAKTRGSWTLHAAEVVTLRQMVWLHGVQLGLCSAGEFHEAYEMTARRVGQARAGNAPAGAVVVEGCIGNMGEANADVARAA